MWSSYLNPQAKWLAFQTAEHPTAPYRRMDDQSLGALEEIGLFHSST